MLKKDLEKLVKELSDTKTRLEAEVKQQGEQIKRLLIKKRRSEHRMYGMVRDMDDLQTAYEDLFNATEQLKVDCIGTTDKDYLVMLKNCATHFDTSQRSREGLYLLVALTYLKYGVNREAPEYTPAYHILKASKITALTVDSIETCLDGYAKREEINSVSGAINNFLDYLREIDVDPKPLSKDEPVEDIENEMENEMD